MSDESYLKNILKSQTLDPDGQEMKDIQSERKEIEKVLRDKFSNLTIRYGGSKAKGTMILESYDLDIIAYFACDDDSAGKSLKEIYQNVEKELSVKYSVERKRSALRLRSKDGKLDFHIDLVPGRYTDEKKQDTFLYQSIGEKGRLKTNLQTHIDHVVESGSIDAIRLSKLWRVKNNLSIKNFILELLVIDLLETKKKATLPEQLKHVLTKLRDDLGNISIKDPANPEGNDLSPLLDDSVRSELSSVAAKTLVTIASNGWEAVFGVIDEESDDEKKQAVAKAVSSLNHPPKPWCQ